MRPLFIAHIFQMPASFCISANEKSVKLISLFVYLSIYLFILSVSAINCFN